MRSEAGATVPYPNETATSVGSPRHRPPISSSQNRKRRWRQFIQLLLCGVAIVQLIPLGLTTTIIPPANPTEPATVFLADYGRTPALILAIADNQMVAYAYGDWAYYALRKQGPIESVAALLWPTQGTLGRKAIHGAPSIETVRAGIGSELENLYRFDVERRALTTLHAKLDRLHFGNSNTATHSYGMTFVHHPQSYTYWTNSNHMTADWLRELRCEIRGPAFSSRWHVRSTQ